MRCDNHNFQRPCLVRFLIETAQQNFQDNPGKKSVKSSNNSFCVTGIRVNGCTRNFKQAEKRFKQQNRENNATVNELNALCAGTLAR